MLQKDHQKTEEWILQIALSTSQQLYIFKITSTACGPVLHVAEQVTITRYQETIYLATQPTTDRTIICQMQLTGQTSTLTEKTHSASH